MPRRFMSRCSFLSTTFCARMSPSAFSSAAVHAFVNTCAAIKAPYQLAFLSHINLMRCSLLHRIVAMELWQTRHSESGTRKHANDMNILHVQTGTGAHWLGLQQSKIRRPEATRRPACRLASTATAATTPTPTPSDRPASYRAAP